MPMRRIHYSMNVSHLKIQISLNYVKIYLESYTRAMGKGWLVNTMGRCQSPNGLLS
jgi:hypothetical protein